MLDCMQRPCHVPRIRKCDLVNLCTLPGPAKGEFNIHSQSNVPLYRRWWRPAHQYNGRLLLLLGLANTFIGIYEAEADNSWYIWVCIVWVAIVGFGVGKTIYNRRSGQAPLAAGSSTPANATTAKANMKAHSSVEMP